MMAYFLECVTNPVVLISACPAMFALYKIWITATVKVRVRNRLRLELGFGFGLVDIARHRHGDDLQNLQT